MEMVKEAVEAGADIIMLDNMDDDMLKEAIAYIDHRAEIEVSGNVTKEKHCKTYKFRSRLCFKWCSNTFCTNIRPFIEEFTCDIISIKEGELWMEIKEDKPLLIF